MKRIFMLLSLVVLVVAGAQAQKKNQAKSISSKMQVSEGIEAMEGADIPLREAFRMRCTTRELLGEKLSEEQIKSVLMAANGYNRPKEMKRTAPSARNAQEIDLYVISEEGVFLYAPEKNDLQRIADGDYRDRCGKQKHYTEAPIDIVLVANYDRMKDFSAESRDFYSAVDCGYVSQNIYLYCASVELGTVACGAIEREELAKILGIKNGKVMLVHPVGRKAK